MSTGLNFPINYKYDRVTPGDYVVNESTSFFYRYTYSQNRAIKILIDMSDADDLRYMFYSCTNLIAIFNLSTNSATDMNSMFSYCSSLKFIPNMNTSKVTNLSNIFSSCSSLESIPLLDCQNVKTMTSIFGYSSINTLTTLGGFKDLGKQSSVSGTSSYFLDNVPNLTHESLLNVIENLYDRKTNGLSTLSIKFGTTNLNKLTDEEKAIAINKGWNLS